MAANDVFGGGKEYMIAPPDVNKYFKLSIAEIAVADPLAFHILRDIEILWGMAKVSQSTIFDKIMNVPLMFYCMNQKFLIT